MALLFVIHVFNVQSKPQLSGTHDKWWLWLTFLLQVYLIEINVNPALHTNCEALKEVIPGVVEETLCKSVAFKSKVTYCINKKTCL